MMFKCKETGEKLTPGQVRKMRCRIEENGRTRMVFPAVDPAKWSDDLLAKLKIERVAE